MGQIPLFSLGFNNLFVVQDFFHPQYVQRKFIGFKLSKPLEYCFKPLGLDVLWDLKNAKL
jgi:hypothetical protein